MAGQRAEELLAYNVYAADSILPVYGYYLAGLSVGSACALAVPTTLTTILDTDKRFPTSC